MLQISTRGQKMPSSPIRKLVPFAEGAKKRGLHVYHLNIGQPDIETPPEFWDQLKNLETKVLSYCPSEGYENYRAKFAAYYNNMVGVKDINASNFVITTGASEALQFTMTALLNAGEEIIVPEPLYANYIGFSSASDIVIKPITTSINNSYALPAISEFEKLITPKTKAILICNPNNPTGYLYSEEELEILKNIVLKHNLYLFSDEVYREFAYNGNYAKSMLHFDELHEHVVVFDSVSKRYSACGARLGAIVTRNKEVLKTTLKFAQARLSPPSLGQLAGATLFDLDHNYYKNIVDEFERRRNVLVDLLSKIEGVKCPSPGGAFYAMAELPVDDTDKFCQWLLEEFDNDGETVMMAPGSGFYSTPGLGKKEVRIAYVLNEKDLTKAIKCLEIALMKYPGRQANVPYKARVKQ